jgi:predicted RNase H-like HicB family nuclease
MKYAYPAIFSPDDGKVLVSVPDLPVVNTFGDDLPEALFMAKDAIEMWLWDAENKHENIPVPSSIEAMRTYYETPNDFASMVAADTDEYRRLVDKQSVRKNLSIPLWLNEMAEKANAPFSQILQQGLKAYLNITE